MELLTMNNPTITNYNGNIEFYQEDIGIHSSFNFDDAEKFLSALCGDDLFTEFDECKFIFQTFDDNEKRKDKNLARLLYGTFDECKNELVKLNNKGAGICVTVNRAAGHERKNEYITNIRALYADFDDNGFPEDYHLEPSIIVNTSNVNGIQKGHAYWLLEDNEELDRFQQNQKLVINHYNSDNQVNELCRVMRLPGFFHRKGEPQLVTLAYCNSSIRYRNQDEVIDLIPAKVDAQEPEKDISPAFTKQVKKVREAKEGERNDTLHKASFVAGGMIRDNVIDEDYAVAILSNAASEAGLSKQEINDTIKKGVKAGKDKSKYKPSIENKPNTKDKGGTMQVLLDIVTKEADLSNLQWNIYKENFIYDGKSTTPNKLRIPLSIENNIEIRTEDLKDVLDYAVVDNTEYHYNAVTSYCDSLIEKYGMETTGYIEQFCEILGLREPIERTYIRNFLIASVARAYNPGCYLDNVILFYGEQGLGKSKFFEDLYGKDYYAQLPFDTSENDIVATCKSVWCGEIGEWERFSSKKSQAEIKTFITKPKDVLRKFYTQSAIDIPRRFVLIGTTNEKDILKDTTGNRRYWVCEVTKKLDRNWITKNRDFIWSEAVAAYLKGEQWWLNETEEVAQKYHNENYTEESLPENQLVLWMNNLYVGQGGKQWNDKLATDGFHLADAITAVFGDKADIEKSKSKITPILKKLGFRSKRKRLGRGAQVSLWFHDDIGKITGKKTPQTFNPTDMKVTLLED
ncbi:MAG: VapE domain-containing protein [Nostoc sp.]|uniref:VapE domain-containing protein n=1 Tax=Nostoc sp. TaxID=1180 RepID=UPI002FFB6587